ncbi:MAG: integrin alpha, partial [Candidatus Binatia bacterium]
LNRPACECKDDLPLDNEGNPKGDGVPDNPDCCVMELFDPNLKGDQGDSFFAWALANVGQVSGTSTAKGELVVGVYRQNVDYNTDGDFLDPKEQNTGTVRLFDGATGSQLGADWVPPFDKAQDRGEFGCAVAAAGDFAGGLNPEVLVSAPGELGNDDTITGRVFLYQDNDPSQLLLVLEGTQQGSQFGRALAGSFDFNGDTVVDFAVGVPEQNGIHPVTEEPTTESGLILVFSGARARNGEAYTLIGVRGHASGDGVGSSVISLGNINGDRYSFRRELY